ncbi:MAG: hypothetical protein ACLFP4_13005 [Spirochaetales bacterium]
MCFSLIFARGLSRKLFFATLILSGMVAAGPLFAERAAAVGFSAPVTLVRWSDNLFQDGTLTRSEASSSLVAGMLASLEYGAVQVRLGYLTTVGRSRFAAFMPPFQLEPYRSPRSLLYLTSGIAVRRSSAWPDGPSDDLSWHPRAGLTYWANLAYEDRFHEKYRDTVSRAERIELDELFLELGTDVEFRVASGWLGRVSLLLGYNLLGEDLAWMQGLIVMNTTRYLPIDISLGAELSLVRPLR